MLDNEKNFNAVMYGDDYDFNKDKEKDLIKVDSLDVGVNQDVGHIKISFKELCSQYAKNALKLRGLTAVIYAFIAYFNIVNDLYKDKQFCCVSLKYLSWMCSCSLASVKRSIKALCDKNIISKLGSGLNGRNIYQVIKIFDYDFNGLIVPAAQSEPLDKKRSKKINLSKDKEFKVDYNFKMLLNSGLSWLRLYGSNSVDSCQCLDFNDNILKEHIKIAQFNIWDD